MTRMTLQRYLPPVSRGASAWAPRRAGGSGGSRCGARPPPRMGCSGARRAASRASAPTRTRCAPAARSACSAQMPVSWGCLQAAGHQVEWGPNGLGHVQRPCWRPSGVACLLGTDSARLRLATGISRFAGPRRQQAGFESRIATLPAVEMPAKHPPLIMPCSWISTTSKNIGNSPSPPMHI